MTPALAHGSVSARVATLAVIVPSPRRVWYWKWKSSALFQMSWPDAVSVYTPFAYSADPARAGVPTSESDHCGGRVLAEVVVLIPAKSE